MNELKDDHYLRAVTELGDKQNIVAHQDIYSKNGIKLVASGVTIKSNFYQHLVSHVLLKPLDLSISAEGMIDSETIWNDIKNLIQKSSNLKKALDIHDKGYRLNQTISSIRLPPPLTFKLTLAREKFPHVYQRSLSILVISAYLARCDGMNLNEEENIAIAALFHDIGLLHIDPKLLDPAHVMNHDERKHLYTHPLTAHLFLREFPELAKSISDTVLNHHELMDGRGYPRGVLGNKISRSAQILAIAEVASKFFAPDPLAQTWEKLEVILKLNSHQYGKGLYEHLRVFRDGRDSDITPKTKNIDELLAQAKLIKELFLTVKQNEAHGRGTAIYSYAEIKLIELKMELMDAGLDPNDTEGLYQRFADEPECVSEYIPMLTETIWQFKGLMQDISRLWPAESNSKNTEYAWVSMVRLLLIAA